MTYKKVKICDHCGTIAEIHKFCTDVTRGKIQLHFCGKNCMMNFFNIEVKVEPKRRTKRKGYKRNNKHPCAMCGLRLASTWHLTRHIRGKHNLDEYMEHVRKTDGIVINSEGGLEKANEIIL